MKGSDDAQPYFVCGLCNAKWFSAGIIQMACPRCGQHTVSRERARPPWKRSDNDPGLARFQAGEQTAQDARM